MGRSRIALLALAAAVLAAGLTSAALAGSDGLTPKQAKAKMKIKQAIKAENKAIKDLKAGNDNAAGHDLDQAQSDLDAAGGALSSSDPSYWDAYDAFEHDEDAFDDSRADAIQDIKDGIKHKKWALKELGRKLVLRGWPTNDFGGNSLLWVGSGLYSSGYNANAIGNLEGTKLATYPVPTANAGLRSLTLGPDGAVWFTEPGADQIGRLDPSTHAITEYAVPTAGAGPYAITTGPDHALWFTETNANQIGRMDPATHQVTEYPIPTAGSYSVAIAAGADGALWFVELEGNKIGRITTSGTVTEYAVPTAGAELSGIAAGPGGMWFTELGTGKVGVISPSGSIKEFDTSSSSSQPWEITRGPDGDMWFTEYAANKIGVVTPSGHIREFAAAGGPGGIAASKTTLYYEEYNGNQVGVVPLTG